MVLTKEQARNLEKRKQEIEQAIKELQRRKKNIEVNTADLRGNRTLLEQKRMQKKMFDKQAMNLRNQKSGVESLLKEPTMKNFQPNVNQKRMVTMEVQNMPRAREVLPKELFKNQKKIPKFNARRFRR